MAKIRKEKDKSSKKSNKTAIVIGILFLVAIYVNYRGNIKAVLIYCGLVYLLYVVLKKAISIKSEKDSYKTDDKNPVELQVENKPNENITPHVKEEYKLPPLSLLKQEERPTREMIKAAREKGEIIASSLCESGIECNFSEASVSSAFTSIKICLKRKSDMNRFLDIYDFVKERFQTNNVYVYPQATDENIIYLLIGNAEDGLSFGSVLSRIQSENDKLKFTLGENYFGQAQSGTFKNTNNLLIARSIFSGKTKLLQSIAVSLICQNDPSTLKMAFIESQYLNYVPFNSIPHLLWPIIDAKASPLEFLQKIYEEKDYRFELFSKIGVRSIDDYNSINIDKSIPQIVIFIDGLDDLLHTNKDIADYLKIIMLTTKITGIHVVATCRSADKSRIPDSLKTSFDGRCAFYMPNSQQSRAILDTSGAEQLAHNGEILYKDGTNDFLRKIITPNISDTEISNVCTFASSQGYSGMDFYFENLPVQKPSLDDGLDSLYYEAKEYVETMGKASTSILQHRFGIGYNRAVKIIDALEDNGIIGPQIGSKPREVYSNYSYSKENHSNKK